MHSKMAESSKSVETMLRQVQVAADWLRRTAGSGASNPIY